MFQDEPDEGKPPAKPTIPKKPVALFQPPPVPPKLSHPPPKPSSNETPGTQNNNALSPGKSLRKPPLRNPLHASARAFRNTVEIAAEPQMLSRSQGLEALPPPKPAPRPDLRGSSRAFQCSSPEMSHFDSVELPPQPMSRGDLRGSARALPNQDEPLDVSVLDQPPPKPPKSPQTSNNIQNILAEAPSSLTFFLKFSEPPLTTTCRQYAGAK